MRLHHHFCLQPMQNTLVILYHQTIITQPLFNTTSWSSPSANQRHPPIRSISDSMPSARPIFSSHHYKLTISRIYDTLNCTKKGMMGVIEWCHQMMENIGWFHWMMPSDDAIGWCHRMMPSDDAIGWCHRMMGAIKWWKPSSDGIHQMMGAIHWWDTLDGGSHRMMEAIKWCKSSNDAIAWWESSNNAIAWCHRMMGAIKWWKPSSDGIH